MDTDQLLGFGLLLLGAICGGSFGLPSKFAKKDTPWEVLWGPFFLMVTILIPVVVATCLAGVIVSGRAGILKERSLQADLAAEAIGESPTSGKNPKMLVGLLIGVISGILCACWAVALEFTKPIGAEATAGGLNPEWAAAWAVTALILWGGAASSCLYCAVQLTRNKTWDHFARPGVGLVLALAAAMAVLHDAAVFFLGLGMFKLGKELSVAVGYPVFMSFAIIVGNVHGFRTGEWKGASRRSVLWIVAGIALLIIGVCVLAKGKSMMP